MAELLVGAGTGIVDQRRALRQQDRQDQLEARQLLEEEVAGRERERRGEELRRQRTVDVRVRIVWHGYGT